MIQVSTFVFSLVITLSIMVSILLFKCSAELKISEKKCKFTQRFFESFINICVENKKIKDSEVPEIIDEALNALKEDKEVK